jgi:predicted Zn-dependent protease
MKQVKRVIAGSVVLLASMLGFAQSRVETPPVPSDKDEVRIGDILVRKFLQEEGNLPTPQTRRFEAYLQKVGDKVVAHAQRKLPYRFHFDPDPSFRSAFALPGRHIVVGAGILAYMDSEDQLAGVLAHEVEHVDLNQCRERLAKELAEKHLSVATANKLAVDPFLPGYGHDNEFAADLAGGKLAMTAGYSPLLRDSSAQDLCDSG